MITKSSLITGITDLLVLSILKEHGDSYAYEISKYIASNSNALLPISHNTIYTVMYKLENEGKISEYTKLVGKKRTRVYYHIEESGRKHLDELLNTYKDMIQGVQYILDSFDSNGENRNE